MTVLVAYASCHGSTSEIAREIGRVLTEAGLPVVVRPMDDPGDLADYQAFVLGSAVHERAWLPGALAFVDDHRHILVGHPVWFFSVGMPAALRGPMRRLAHIEGERIEAELTRRIPGAPHRLFSGRYLRRHTGFFGNLLFRAIGGRYGDYRDPQAISGYAHAIGEYLVSA